MLDANLLHTNLLYADLLQTCLLCSNALPGYLLQTDLLRADLLCAAGQLLPNVCLPPRLPGARGLHLPLRPDRLYLCSGQRAAYGASCQTQFGLLLPLAACNITDGCQSSLDVRGSAITGELLLPARNLCLGH